MKWSLPLTYLNSIPFPVTTKYYVAFGAGGEHLSGTLRGGNDWQVLRNEHPRYRIPDMREAWLQELTLDGTKDGQDSALLERVESLAALIKREHIKTLFSVGSGGGVFEYYLKKRLPGLNVIATECTSQGVARLKKVFLEADAVELFDALEPHEWARVARLPAVLVFIYRNEREFSDEQWRAMFEHMHAAGVERVFMGLMWTFTLLAFIFRKWNNLKARLRGERISFAGYIRNFRGLERLWQGEYTVEEEISFPACRGLYLIRTNSL